MKDDEEGRVLRTAPPPSVEPSVPPPTPRKTVEEVIAEEIDSICVNYWYDGVSWAHHLTEEERARAYDAVFAEMLRAGRYELGMVEPYVHHNGNGHYVVVDARRES